MEKKIIKRYIFVTYPYVDHAMLSRLVAQYAGERVSMDLDLVQTLAAAQQDFLQAYALLVKEAMQTRAFIEASEQGLLDFADGNDSRSVADDVSLVTDSLIGASEEGRSWLELIFGQKNKPYEYDMVMAGNQIEMTRELGKQAMTRYIVIGVVVVAVIAGIVMLTRRK